MNIEERNQELKKMCKQMKLILYVGLIVISAGLVYTAFDVNNFNKEVKSLCDKLLKDAGIHKIVSLVIVDDKAGPEMVFLADYVGEQVLIKDKDIHWKTEQPGMLREAEKLRVKTLYWSADSKMYEVLED